MAEDRRSGVTETEQAVPPPDSAVRTESPPAPDSRRWKALALLCVAFFMVQLDAQIVILALPSIQDELAFSSSGVQWVMSSYLLTFGGLLLLGGRAADLLGRRRMFMIGMAIFLASSLLAGLAWSSEVLIVARVGQGLSAAIIAPTALSILLTTFTDGKELNKALAIWAANGAGGAMAALLIGGPITDTLGWEWIFFINIPIALAVLALAPGLLQESVASAERRAFDVLGAVTVTLALVSFIYAVVETPNKGWGDPQTIVLLLVAAVLLGLFVLIEQRAVAPLVPLRLFKSRNLVGGNVVMLLIGMVTFGAVLLISLYAQRVLGYSALAFGLSTVIYTVMSVAGSQTGARVVPKLGFRNVSLISTGLMAVGILLLTQISTDGNYWMDLFPGLVLFGFGLGLGFVSVSIAALTGIPAGDSGVASGINTAAFQMGGALGVAVVSAVAVSATDRADVLSDLTDGYQAGFYAALALTVFSLIVGFILFKTPKSEPAA
jgi:EmrB/QacA subfamily drug resistance transporter